MGLVEESVREGVCAYLVVGHPQGRWRKYSKEQRESSKLQDSEQGAYCILWIGHPERPCSTANFSLKKLTAPMCKEDLHERDDRMDSAQTEKLKCRKMKGRARSGWWTERHSLPCFQESITLMNFNREVLPVEKTSFAKHVSLIFLLRCS